MAKDYIPGSDTGFQAWADNFSAYLSGHSLELGVSAGEMAAIVAVVSNFNTAMSANTTAQQAAQAARQTKDAARDNAESAIRELVRKLQASSDVNDTERAALGITVPDRTPTTALGGITTRPVGMVDTSQRLRHEIRFTDEATPTSRAKPAGVMGCEIWVKVLPTGDPPPVGSDGLTFLTLDTATPYIAEFDGADGGKTAHYMLRWVKSSGDKGPWSETVSATIGA